MLPLTFYKVQKEQRQLNYKWIPVVGRSREVIFRKGLLITKWTIGKGHLS